MLHNFEDLLHYSHFPDVETDHPNQELNPGGMPREGIAIEASWAAVLLNAVFIYYRNPVF